MARGRQPEHAADWIAALQQALGNRAVGALVDRQSRRPPRPVRGLLPPATTVMAPVQATVVEDAAPVTIEAPKPESRWKRTTRWLMGGKS